MMQSKIIDTFPFFMRYWGKAQNLSVDEQIQRWELEYMARFPELLQKQIQDYRNDGYNWRKIAREKVVPFWSERLPAMIQAHDNLLKVCQSAYAQAQEKLNYTSELTFVIYAGIASGAGWATTYQDNDAILCGLENIAELGWQDPTTLKRLMSHEIGHLWHFGLRNRPGYQKIEGPWWSLYTEGIANRCEDILTGEETGHIFAQQGDWLEWCQRNKSWLAHEFLGTVDKGEKTLAFFASWCDIRGYKQTGYFLGQEAVKQMEGKSTMQEIALIRNPESVLRPILESFAVGFEA